MDRKGRSEENISSKDRTKGLSGLQMVPNLVVQGIPLLSAPGEVPSNSGTAMKECFLGRLQIVA